MRKYILCFLLAVFLSALTAEAAQSAWTPPKAKPVAVAKKKKNKRKKRRSHRRKHRRLLRHATSEANTSVA